MKATANEVRYNTRLLKGAALLEEMRQLVRSWEETDTISQRQKGVRSNVLNKVTRMRTADIFQHVFLPRFIQGPIPNAWKLVRPLEDANAPIALTRPVYFWITTQSEPIIADFCREYLLPRQFSARVGVEVSDAVAWLESKEYNWSSSTTTKLAQGLLAALRDFGILEGKGKKRLSSIQLPVGSFAYIAFCMSQLGASPRQIVSHSDWQLFFLTSKDVEQLFLHAHQLDLLEYNAAGSIIRLDFPASTLREYADVVVERSH